MNDLVVAVVALAGDQDVEQARGQPGLEDAMNRRIVGVGVHQQNAAIAHLREGRRQICRHGADAFAAGAARDADEIVAVRGPVGGQKEPFPKGDVVPPDRRRKVPLHRGCRPRLADESCQARRVSDRLHRVPAGTGDGSQRRQLELFLHVLGRLDGMIHVLTEERETHAADQGQNQSQSQTKEPPGADRQPRGASPPAQC